MEWSEAEGRTQDLLKAAVEEQPANAKLRDLGQQFGLAPAIAQPMEAVTTPEMNSVIAVTPTRLRYRMSTDGGSSGAPVFDASLTVVALHLARGMDGDGVNEALPLTALLERPLVREALGL